MKQALDDFFYPKKVAVIGASATPGKIGHVIMQNLSTGKFRGKIFPINPNHPSILGIKTHKTITAVKEAIDLAVICVPANAVAQTFEECGKKHVPAVIIVTAGFSETGDEFETAQLKKLIAKYPRTRVIGPNCLGVFNAENGLDSLFLPEYRLERPGFGAVSFISQSGALGSAVLDWAAMREYGISKFVSYGNAIDVDETDLIEYLVNDPKTKVVVIYLEGAKNGRKLFEKARKLAHKKPIIAIKGGKSAAGNEATMSHTGSMAGSYDVYRALFKQTGIIEAESVSEIFDLARTFSQCPLPKGNRVQVITDGGGYGVLTTDEIIKEGLKMAKMSDKNRAYLKKNFPDFLIIKNPLDLTGSVTNEYYQTALDAAISDKEIDAIIAIVLYQVPLLDSEVVNTISEMNKKSKKPILVVSVGGTYSEIHKKAMEREGVVNFAYPEDAVKAVKALANYAKFREKK